MGRPYLSTMGRTLSNKLFHSSSSSGEDTRCERPGGEDPEGNLWAPETRRNDSRRDRAFPSRSSGSTEAFQNLKGIQRNRSRETQYRSSGISGSSPSPECCGSQTALTFESLMWGGVSGRR